ncbi:NfeD family protein [Candidatus Roseilinea sp. NK_OTU-006]|jgi:membrane-bound serine protease (ClpP class)|nr:NfeD family protein [Candidatus Roseilinea sp. NK_OTU-006]
MDIGQAVFDVIANPNIAYALLMLGLIALVMAFAVPGTGLLEIGAGLCLLLALLGLSRLPVNIAGLLLILAGIGLLIADIQIQSGLVALGGAILLGIGSLFLFRPDERAFAVSWWLIMLASGGSAIFFGFGLHRALHAMQQRPVISPDNILGAHGVIKSPLTPESQFTGTAQVAGELWTVKSDEPIGEGAPIVVLQVEGLTLFVRALAHPPEQAEREAQITEEKNKK